MSELTALQQKAAALDAADPLRDRAALFDLPTGSIYLDGNSLGPPPKGVVEHVNHVASVQWGQDLIASWNKHGWMTLTARIAGKLALLLGTTSDNVRCCDSTSVNLLKAITAALSLRKDRHVIVSERGNFPTDLYVVQEMIAGLGRNIELRLIEDAETDLPEALQDDVAVVLLTQVDYRSGRRLNMSICNDLIHSCGALCVWDLAHSAGAFEVALDRDRADFAVGCGYKFLNGGPGAPAFIFVADQHLAEARPLLAGWLGHAAPFDFTSDYKPARGIDRYIVGTPPILSMAAMDAALDAFAGVDMSMVAAKTAQLTSLFIEAVEALALPNLLTLATPREADRRGGHVSFQVEEGYGLVQALIGEGITGDFRAPNIARFGFSALYLSHAQIVTAAAALADILAQDRHKDSAYAVRAAVT